MKSSTVLNEVKNLIKNNDEHFICVAITALEIKNNDDVNYHQCCNGIKIKIKELLGGSPTLETWLHRNHNIDSPRYQDGTEDYDNKIRKTRLAWLSWLIKEYKKNND